MRSQYIKFEFFAMGGENEIQLYASDLDEAKSVAKKVVAEVHRIEEKYSRYREDSIISTINREAGKAPVKLDLETASLLRYADACYRQSNGLFDITSGVLRKVWNFKDSKLPSSDAISSVLNRIGWKKVQFNGQQVLLSEHGMEIDFGGIGKEYAVDRAVGVLAEHGIESGLVNLAGDLRSIGPRPDGSPWRVGIIHPREQGAVSRAIELYQGAIATSGDYERFITVGGKRYCHILNPHTGWPVRGNQSVTVVAESCLIAGSASTTAMLLGVKAKTYLKDLTLSHCIIDQKGESRLVARDVYARSKFRWIELPRDSEQHFQIPISILSNGNHLGE